MKKTIKLALIGMIALTILTFTVAPSSARADFWDDFVDFLNPVEHVKNIIDGRPQDNLPPIPTPVEIIDPFCLYACDDHEDNHQAQVQAPAQNQNPPTVSFWANPTMVSYNGSSILTWNSDNATSCVASGGTVGWPGNRNTSGAFSVGGLTNTTTFIITCSNNVGSISGSTTVTVNNPPIQTPSPTVNISAIPSNIEYNGASAISWSSSNATSCVASGGTPGWTGNRNTSGNFYIGSLTNTTTFYISCSNSTGTVSRSATINVGNNNNYNYNYISVNITADDGSIDYEDSTRIRWSSNNAQYCNASGGTNGWSGNQNTSGTFYTGSLVSDKTFRITCYNNNNSANDSITIRVDDDGYNDNDSDITTKSATNVATTSATLNGRVDGSSSSTRAWFEYGSNTNFGYTTTKSSYGSNSTNFSRSISGLMPNTTYYFRAVAESSRDRVFGNIMSFSTTGSYINPVNNQPTAIVYADQPNIGYNSATTIRWNTANASSCFASGGSLGWAGAKNVGPGFFYTGAMTSSRTFTLTCSNGVGYSNDAVTVNVRQPVTSAPAAPRATTPSSSMVLIASSIERNQIGAPRLDNTLNPGDEVNYLISYQNVGSSSISGLTLRIDLDPQTFYISSSPANGSKLGNIIILNLGTLKGNEQGMASVRVLIQPNIIPGTNMNFTATLSYIDPAKAPKSVTTNTSAQVFAVQETVIDENIFPEANAIGAGFFPADIFGWLMLIILILVLLLLSRHLYNQFAVKKTVYVEEHHDHH